MVNRIKAIQEMLNTQGCAGNPPEDASYPFRGLVDAEARFDRRE
jgi:hypothetical protein